MIIVGHTRYKAAIKLGMQEVPVHIAVGLSPEKARAYRIADNQTAAIATWDEDRLPMELMALQEAGFNLELTGFSAEELLSLLQACRDGLTDPDDVPEPPDAAIPETRRPLDTRKASSCLCGDSAKPKDVDRLLDDASIHLSQLRSALQREGRAAFEQCHRGRPVIFRDYTPPTTRCGPAIPRKAQPTTQKLRAKDRPLENDFVSDEDFQRRCSTPGSATSRRVLLPGRAFYLWGGYSNIGNYPLRPLLPMASTFSHEQYYLG